MNSILIGHYFIGFYFAFFGIWNIYHWRPILEVMIKKNIPHSLFLLPVGICWQIILGCMLIFGIFIKIAALLLIPFTLIAVFLFHPFWQFTGETRKLNFTIFIANLTVVIGALVLLTSNITSITHWADLLS